MALYAKIGDDGLVHRVSSAMFEKDNATGIAFCRVEGKVVHTESEVVTCQGCRDVSIKYAMDRLNPSDSGGSNG